MELDTAIAEFVADLKLAGRAPRTIESHQLELLRLGRWCDEHGHTWHQLVRKQLLGYTRLRADLGHSSRSNMLCTLQVVSTRLSLPSEIACAVKRSLLSPISNACL